MEKYNIDIREDACERLTDSMYDLVYDRLLSGLMPPNVSIEGYLDWDIPHEDVARLRHDLKESIEDAIKDAELEPNYVDVDSIVDNVDFHEYYRPSDQEFEKYREYDDSIDGFRFFREYSVASVDSQIDRLFNDFKKR